MSVPDLSYHNIWTVQKLNLTDEYSYGMDRIGRWRPIKCLRKSWIFVSSAALEARTNLNSNRRLLPHFILLLFSRYHLDDR